MRKRKSIWFAAAAAVLVLLLMTAMHVGNTLPVPDVVVIYQDGASRQLLRCDPAFEKTVVQIHRTIRLQGGQRAGNGHRPRCY